MWLALDGYVPGAEFEVLHMARSDLGSGKYKPPWDEIPHDIKKRKVKRRFRR